MNIDGYNIKFMDFNIVQKSRALGVKIASSEEKLEMDKFNNTQTLLSNIQKTVAGR